MAIDLYKWGSAKPIYFKATLNGEGVTSLTFQANDLKLSLDEGVTFINASTAGTITECGGSLGWYKWVPSAGSTMEVEDIILNLKDDVGSEFDENSTVLITGGNVNARLNGV